MSLETPETIRNLRKKLYLKAKVLCHEVPSRGTRRFSHGTRLGWLDVGRLRKTRRVIAAVGREVKLVGEPDAGNPHVRFDERCALQAR
jgi:hypothetical protein